MCLFLFSQVIYGPRRGPTFNNRWWNDRREWNLRISIREGEGVPKGGEQHPVLLLFAPFGDGRESISYPQVPFPSVIPPAVIHIRPLRGRQLGCPIAFFSSFFPKLLYPFYTAFPPFYTISAFHYTPTILFSQTFGNASFIPYLCIAFPNGRVARAWVFLVLVLNLKFSCYE